jgi:hypothetical protein
MVVTMVVTMVATRGGGAGAVGTRLEFGGGAIAQHVEG